MRIIIETKTKKQALQPASIIENHSEIQNPTLHYPTAALRNP